MKKALFICMVCLCSAAFAEDNAAPAKPKADTAAAAAPDFRLCQNEDLVGMTWALSAMVETPPRREALFFKHNPFQYITFYKNGTYAYLSSPKQIKTVQELQKRLEWPQKLHRRLPYVLGSDGVLNLFMGRRSAYSFRCTSIKVTKNGFVKDDLVLKGYTKKKRSQLYKLYRRWY